MNLKNNEVRSRGRVGDKIHVICCIRICIVSYLGKYATMQLTIFATYEMHKFGSASQYHKSR
jgi:hypothetical protein